MKQYPSVPRAADAPPGLFDAGHLWIQEQVDGGHLRFRLLDSGRLAFGDRERTLDPDDVPLPYRHAVRHVRERVDRTALRSARDDASSVVFFGVATYRRAVDYDWDRVPAFLGFDVWDAEEGRFLSPDAVEQVYDRLGLRSVNTFEKEVRATDFDPADYEIPESAWYDGPAAGVVVRNKTGQRAMISNPEVSPVEEASPGTDADAIDGESTATSAEDLVAAHVTRERVEAVVRDLEDRGRPVTVDAVFERAVEAVARRHPHLFGDDAIDASAFRSAAAEQVTRFLDE